MLAYCLMPNHVHLVAVPERIDSLAVVFRRVHGRYSQYPERAARTERALVAEPILFMPLDEHHLLTALRYVERNPVRAGLVAEAEGYAWSSARAHITGRQNTLLDWQFWEQRGGIASWAGLLAQEEELQTVRLLQRFTYSGRPLGRDEWYDRLETELNIRIPKSVRYSKSAWDIETAKGHSRLFPFRPPPPSYCPCPLRFTPSDYCGRRRAVDGAAEADAPSCRSCCCAFRASSVRG